MSDDLIRRQDAIDALHTRFRDGFEEDKWWNSTHVLAALEGVPSAQPKPQWIPCSERFPELDQQVLVYAIGKEDGFIGDSVIALSKRFIFRLFSSSDGVEEWRSPWQYFSSNYEITHWMPLPNAPKGAERC